MKPIDAVLIGAGHRGADIYGGYGLQNPDRIRFVGIAERNPARRETFALQHGIAPERQFTSSAELFRQPRFAEAAIICTPDREHFEPAMEALRQGYQVLLEKPIATSLPECRELERLALKTGNTLMVCFVLRYAPFYQKVKSLLDSGIIGEPVSIHQDVHIGFAHYSHGYVRGRYRSAALSCPLALSFITHDLDMLLWLAGSKAVSVHSLGGLSYFNAAHAPQGAPEYCLDGCPAAAACPYYAPNIYLGDQPGFHTKVIAAGGAAERLEALRKGPFGKCVFRNDNDVCDHQQIQVSFENKAVGSLNVNGLTHDCDRYLYISGTRGELSGRFTKGRIEVHEFISGNPLVIQLPETQVLHGGGDQNLMADFVRAARSGGDAQGFTLISHAAQSHYLALAAEESRTSGQAVRLESFMGGASD